MTVGNLTYTLSYTTITPSGGIPISSQPLNTQTDCSPMPTTASVPPGLGNGVQVTAINLPNGQQYQFHYDPSSGLLDKITYPSGGTVSYTWGVNPLSATILYNGSSSDPSCKFVYDTPAVTKRIVSFDGVNPAIQQDFSYATTWGSNPLFFTTKTTTVTTQDLIRGTTSKVVYTYSDYSFPSSPNTSTPINLPVEKTIQYYDNGGTTLLKTITKNWNLGVNTLTEWSPLPALACQLETLDNGLITGSFYSYGSQAQIQLTDVKTYDYGILTSTSACLTNQPPSTTPTLEEKVTYQSFGNTPIYTSGPSIFDRPATIQIYGNGTLASETDYAYDGSSVASVSATGHDDTNYGSGFTSPRGNVTKITQKCLSGCSQDSVTTYTFDDTGQVVSKLDPCGNATCSDMTGGSHTTTYSYADSYSTCSGAAPAAGNTNAYVTQVTDALGHTAKFCYGYDDGQLRGSTDANGQTTLYNYADPLGRIKETDYPDGGQTLVSYNDLPPNPSITTSKLISSGHSLTTVKKMDGVGHVIDSELTTDPAGTDHTYTTYSGIGLPLTVYNTTRCNPPTSNCGEATWGYTTYSYDGLGRTTLTKHSDGSTIQTGYTGRAMKVTDEGNGTKNVQRISQTDSFGRMVSVCEVSGTTQLGNSGSPVSCGQDISATGFLTTYTYDILGDLTTVAQSSSVNGQHSCQINLVWYSRCFTYDSLRRLVTAVNPESGSTSYTYDPNGNVASRTESEPNQTNSANTVTTSYVYDALNRLTAKQYSDSTDNVDYNYDETSPWGFTLTNAIGRLTTEYDGNTGSVFSYDAMGRIVQNHQCTPQNCGTGDFPVAYTYDFLGDMVTSTDGEGNTYTRLYNNAADLTSMTSSYVDANHPASLLSEAGYDPLGQMTIDLLGNGVTETRSYNSRTELTSVADGSLYTLSLGHAPDGNVTSANDSVNGNWTYTYDDFNRLSSATGAGQAYTYGYDRFGNRWNQELSGSCTSGSAVCLTFDANNHINNGLETYDAAGNVMTDGFHNYFYDAEHHLVQVDGSAGYCQSGTGTQATACYTYDAEGRRVRRAVPGSGITDDYIYDLAGHFVTQVSGGGWWIRGEIYAGGRHIATYENDLQTPTTFFNHTDWLGTERVQSAVNGTACETVTSLPFGDGMDTSGSCDPTSLRFTGKERDWESNLDNFGARYNSSNLGRFMSPDPDEASGFAHMGDPQSWNGYSYVRNDPLNGTDPSGMILQLAGDIQADEQGLCALAGNDCNMLSYEAGPDGTVTVSVSCQAEHCSEPGLTPGLMEIYAAVISPHVFVVNTYRLGNNSLFMEILPKSAWVSLWLWASGHKVDIATTVLALALGPEEKISAEAIEEVVGRKAAEDAASEIEPLVRDATGKIHGAIPDYVPENWTKEDLESVRGELKESIKRRNEEQIQKGEEGGHRERIRREERFLRQIEKKLGGS